MTDQEPVENRGCKRKDNYWGEPERDPQKRVVSWTGTSSICVFNHDDSYTFDFDAHASLPYCMYTTAMLGQHFTKSLRYTVYCVFVDKILKWIAKN